MPKQSCAGENNPCRTETLVVHSNMEETKFSVGKDTTWLFIVCLRLTVWKLHGGAKQVNQSSMSSNLKGYGNEMFAFSSLFRYGLCRAGNRETLAETSVCGLPAENSRQLILKRINRFQNCVEWRAVNEAPLECRHVMSS